MRFAISLAFQPVDQLVAIAREADACGYDALAIPDHVVEIEELDTPYPYTPNGKRRWNHAADWPDPWVRCRLRRACAAAPHGVRWLRMRVRDPASPSLTGGCVSPRLPCRCRDLVLGRHATP